MRVLDTLTQNVIKVEVLRIEIDEFKSIKKSNQFVFDWNLEKEKEVYKLVKYGEFDSSTILGLMSFTDFREELRIHINLIESSNDNKGKRKLYDGVAGCLLSFAIRTAFAKGYQGFISLVPKTRLIKLYIEKYGFEQFGRQLGMYGKKAIELIEKYD